MSSRSNPDGCLWDTGPTLLTLPQEIQETFDNLNGYGDAPPELIPLSSVASLRFVDGTAWDLPSGAAALEVYFQERNPVLARELKKALALAREVFAFAEECVLGDEPPSPVALGLKTLTTGLSLRHPELARLPYDKLIDRAFSDANMREFFFHFASYVGVQPGHAAASLISVAHVELGSPVVFPRGGVYGLARWLMSACEAAGVATRFGRTVVSARPRGGEERNSGWTVTTAEDGPWECDALIVNADPHGALSGWLDAPELRRDWVGDLEARRLRPSESQFVVLFERDEISPLPHHLKLFPRSFRTSYEQVCAEGQLPDDPCIYLVWPHATDPTYPARSLFLSTMAPNLASGHAWDPDACAALANQTLERARRRLGAQLPGRVYTTLSPRDLQVGTGSLAGGLYGASPTRYSPFHFQRPSRAKPANLHFVGGGVHPGAGVPMVLKGARRVASDVARAFGRASRRGAEEGVRSWTRA